MGMLFKIVGGTIMVLSALVVMGTAGSDCDGKCMENALSIGETLFNFTMALIGGWIGYHMFMYGVERDV